MSRSTHGNDITVTSPEWNASEQVICRSVPTKHDVMWIEEQSTQTVRSASGAVEQHINAERKAAATVAAMVRSWTLTQDKLDNQGNPLCMPDGTIMQEPRRLGDTLSERMEAVGKMHDADVDLIYSEIFKAQQKLQEQAKTEQEQKAFTSNASVPTPGN